MFNSLKNLFNNFRKSVKKRQFSKSANATIGQKSGLDRSEPVQFIHKIVQNGLKP